MAKSANGWPVITDRAKLRKVKVPGTGVVFWLADDDDVVTILTAVAWWIDTHIEDLDTRKGVASHDVPDDWSWAVRLIRGATRTISNHASGTAVDLNAVAHPMKARGTWGPSEVRAIDSFLASLGGTVRWGEHFRRVDGMHFEINTTDRAALRRAAAVARRVLSPAPTPTPAPATPAPHPQEDDDMPTAAEVAAAIWRQPLTLGPRHAEMLAQDGVHVAKDADGHYVIAAGDALIVAAARSMAGQQDGVELAQAVHALVERAPSQ